MLYILFDYVAAILEICKLILPHDKFSLIPPHFTFPMFYGSYMPNFTILIRNAGFATFLALNKPTILTSATLSTCPSCIFSPMV